MRFWVIFATLAAGRLQGGVLALKPETLKCFDEYLHGATIALQERATKQPFLWLDEDQRRLARAREGEIVIWSAGEKNPKGVPSGLIHDWMGAVFVPNAHLGDLLSVVRDYSRYTEVFKPGVVSARLLKQTASDDTFSMLLRNGSYFTRTIIDGDYHSTYVQVDGKRWYSISCSTRVQEIENYGQPSQHELPPDEGHGYIWRICGLSQFEERDGGVYIDEEAIALSRDIPAAFRWFVDPIVRRVSKESLALSMEETRAAVGAKAHETNVSRTSGTGSRGVCQVSGGCFR